jgi:hypothetical protein
MPGKSSLMAVICGLALLAACTEGSNVEPQRKFISFKLDSGVMLSEQRNAAYYMPGNVTDTDPTNDYSQLSLSGYSYNKDVINLRMYSDAPEITPGVYSNMDGGTAMFLEMKETGDILMANEMEGLITIVLQSVQDSVAIGQFSGNLVSISDGSIKTVKDGYFKLIYKKFP